MQPLLSFRRIRIWSSKCPDVNYCIKCGGMNGRVISICLSRTSHHFSDHFHLNNDISIVNNLMLCSLSEMKVEESFRQVESDIYLINVNKSICICCCRSSSWICNRLLFDKICIDINQHTIWAICVLIEREKRSEDKTYLERFVHVCVPCLWNISKSYRVFVRQWEKWFLLITFRSPWWVDDQSHTWTKGCLRSQWICNNFDRNFGRWRMVMGSVDI